MIYRLAAFVTGVLLMTAFGVNAASAQDEQLYNDILNDTQPSVTYIFDLQVGQSILITADALTGDLDPIVSLKNSQGTLVAENDDRNDNTHDSALGYTASLDGTYTLTVSRYERVENSGTYKLKVAIGDESVLQPLDALTAVQLSGRPQTIDTEHFRIHYTQQGVDAVAETFANFAADTMESVWQIEIVQMGWPAPPTDGVLGGDSRFDVYLKDMLDGDGSGAMGVASPGSAYGDNPNTLVREKFATYTTIRLDNDFAELVDENNTAENLLKATAAHEFHHAVQDGFDSREPYDWYFEATSTWMETAVFPKQQDATIYVEYNYDNPDLCFATSNDPDGMLMYGDWMFMQSLVDAHGKKVVQRLWTNIALGDGFHALERTLAEYDDNIPNAVARYRIQNVLRSYKFAAYFGNAKVRMEQRINRSGRWQGGTRGIQELGANYYDFSPPPGEYNVQLIDDNSQLEVWAIGVKNKEAVAIPLGRGGNITTAGYDHVYLMVFNPVYDNNVDDCSSTTYTLRVTTSNGPLAEATQTWDARYFLPLK